MALDEYLGSDGLKISQAHGNYLVKCDEFLAKARQRKRERIRGVQSVIHSNIFGYEPDEIFESEILENRRGHIKTYEDSFNVTRFDENKESMYENFNGKTKRIRIIRELSKAGVTENEKFSAGGKSGQTWFMRFFTLSRFIQVVRMTILRRRLEKRLEILKRLTPDIVKELERDYVNLSSGEAKIERNENV